LNDIQKIKDVIGSTDRILLAIRADGGHKYRRFVRLSDEELDVLTKGAERSIRGAVLRLLAAENVIERCGKTDELEVELKEVEEQIRKAGLAAAAALMPAPVVSINRTQRRRLARKQRAMVRGDA
jgi:hypothetical protein